MELSETTINILLGLAVLLMLAVNFFVKKRKMESTALGRVVTILDDLRHNAKVAETFSFHHTIQRFRTSHWYKGKDKLDYIPIDVRSRLEKAFDLAEDANERINAAKRHGSNSYMAGIDVDKMKQPISIADQILREWLQENMDNPELQPKKRGLFGGGLFGQ